ncbi:DUF3347 domain-containing protein [bacterium]|nr:MAG: DUF3347 domain-containing protein [bacterium]
MKKLLLTILLGALSLSSVHAQEAEAPKADAHELHLKNMITTYLSMTKALYSDDFETAKSFAVELQKEVASQKPGQMKHEMGKGMKDGMGKGKEMMKEGKKMGEQHGIMLAAVTKAVNAPDIKALRAELKPISDHLIHAAKNHGFEQLLYVQFCPMADNNKGAYWLSTQKDILNPYFGSMMLSCGTTKETIGEEK